MKVLSILLITFIVAVAASKLISGDFNWTFSGRLAMCVMLCFTGIGHFVMLKGMMMMIPPFIPYKKELIWVTGILEIASGIALLFPACRYIAALVLTIFFIIIIPSNIYAAIKKVNIEKASFDGPGESYLWFRIPLQLFFIAWICYFAVYRN
ncbi:MAG: hypothetical protein ABIN67_07020 [Ferruginibacter sp.]